MADQPLVLLVEPQSAQHAHAEKLSHAGFRVATVAAPEFDVARVLAQSPAVIAAELDGSGSVATLSLARQFRQNPQGRPIPFIVFGHHLRNSDIEDIARAGALWLQLEPADGARLVAAVRGLIAASQKADADRLSGDAKRR
jgi:CheY-like chemotaxis protein